MSNTLLDLVVSDTSRQRVKSIEEVSPDYTAAELVQGLLQELGLATHDHSGRSYSYHAFNRREARHLGANERIGDACETGDWLVLQPEVNAAQGLE
ncbi:MAG: hypothetical protein JSW50_12285 [Candidatus Latescibacterota bacterium]|nr:MAG: hypothetical protein JSW50_12285 [Candidatus Latescibacterota bacterium]